MSEPTFSIDRIVAALSNGWEPDLLHRQQRKAVIDAMPDIRALILSLQELECGDPRRKEGSTCGACSGCLTNELRSRLTK